MGLEQRFLSCWASVRFGRAYPSLGNVRRKAEKICLDICLWYVYSNVCSNLLPLPVQKQTPEVFCRKGVLKNFAIFTGKHLCWRFFLRKLQIWRLATLLKRDPNTGVFLWILRNSQEYLYWKTSSNGCFRLSKNIR